MFDLFNNLEPTVQAAIITGSCTVIGAFIGLIGHIIKKKGDNKPNVSKKVKQKNSALCVKAELKISIFL